MERIELSPGCWVDVERGFLADAATVYDTLVENASWRQARIFRYEKYYDEPRLTAGFSLTNPAHRAVVEAHRFLRDHYGVSFDAPGLAWYRDGNDSVAFHRDRDMRWCEDTIIVIISLGARRPFKLRPRANRFAHELPDRGGTHDLAPGDGDLLVMGGRCQVEWEHSVPKVRGLAEGRVSIQWRYTSKRGRPEIGAGYRAPRLFSSGHRGA